MTHRTRLLTAAGAVALPVVLAPLLVRPLYAIGLVVAAAVVALAARSVAYPVALAGLPAVAVGLAGATNPFPQGAVALFGFAWTAIAIALAVLRDADELPARVLFTAPLASTVLLALWLLARLGSSLDPSYGSRKLQLFLAGNLTLLVAGILIGRRRARFQLWVFAALLLSVLSAIALARGLLAGEQATVGGRFSITADNSPIGLGREAAEGITLAVFALLLTRTAWLRVLAFGALPLVAVSLLASGSRGPLLGLLLGVVTLLLLSAGDASARRRIGLVVAAAVGAVLLVPQLVPGQDVGRALSLFTGGQGSNGRTDLWHHAWRLFAAHPLFGTGTGSFAFVEPVELYPHDLLLEAGVELGIVGVLLVAVLLASTVARLVRLRPVAVGDDRAHVSLVAALFVTALVNALVSGDIAANSGVWLAAGLALGLTHRLGLEARRLDLAGLRGLGSGLRRRVESAPAPRPAPPAAENDPGAVVSPAAGAAVDGIVRVAVEPARTGRPVAAVRLEWRRGKAWLPAAEADERTYEFDLPGGAAVVRSRVLAEAVAAQFETRPRPSARRPWAAWRQVELTLDTRLLAPGPVELRAVTVDESGASTPSPPVEVTVTRAAPEPGEPEPLELAEPPKRLGRHARRSRTVLEAAIDSHPELDDARRESLEALLRFLMLYATPDGTLPARFDALVDEEFGDLLEGL